MIKFFKTFFKVIFTTVGIIVLIAALLFEYVLYISFYHKIINKSIVNFV